MLLGRWYFLWSITSFRPLSISCAPSLLFMISSHILSWHRLTVLSLGTLDFGMNMTVFFPFTYLIPWASCPNSFAKDLSQVFFSGPLIRCLYSWATPEILWVTEFASLLFWNFSVNAYCGRGFLLHLDLKLELGPSLYVLGGCAVFTLVDGIGTSGLIMCGTYGEMWTLWW